MKKSNEWIRKRIIDDEIKPIYKDKKNLLKGGMLGGIDSGINSRTHSV
jgi:hypothetical protein